MLKAAIEKIIDLKKPGFIEIDGKKYKDDSYSPVFEKFPNCLNVSNLTGLVDYANNPPEQWETDFFIHVADYNEVALYQGAIGDFQQRAAVIMAESRPCQFEFGKYLDPETFKIGLHSQFISNDDTAHILNFISHVKFGAESNIEDDGVTQTVTAKMGASSLMKETKIKPIVSLQPYRTFNEIEQPESEFLFRMKGDSDGLRLMLTECDGERWKQTAIQRIAEYLKTNTKVPVIA